MNSVNWTVSHLLYHKYILDCK